MCRNLSHWKHQESIKELKSLDELGTSHEDSFSSIESKNIPFVLPEPDDNKTSTVRDYATPVSSPGKSQSGVPSQFRLTTFSCHDQPKINSQLFDVIKINRPISNEIELN